MLSLGIEEEGGNAEVYEVYDTKHVIRYFSRLNVRMYRMFHDAYVRFGLSVSEIGPNLAYWRFSFGPVGATSRPGQRNDGWASFVTH